MSELTQKIRSRAYWTLSLSPAVYSSERIPYSDLLRIVQRASVNLRGWDFPHMDPHENVERDANFIAQESSWHQYHEAWRFHQSGQFLDLWALWEDWYDESDIRVRPDEWAPGKYLAVANTIHRFTEIFEFAARLTSLIPGEESLDISLKIVGLKDRELLLGRERIPFSHPRRTSMQEFPYEMSFSRGELIARPRELALVPLLNLFERFDWTPGPDTLRDWQAKIGT